MIRPTLILAALAALCAPPATEAAFYRATDHTLACAALADMDDLIQLALSDAPGDSEKYIDTAKALLRSGRCVFVAPGARLIITRIDGQFAEIDVSADPRPLWAHVSAIDWSAR